MVRDFNLNTLKCNYETGGAQEKLKTEILVTAITFIYID